MKKKILLFFFVIALLSISQFTNAQKITATDFFNMALCEDVSCFISKVQQSKFPGKKYDFSGDDGHNVGFTLNDSQELEIIEIGVVKNGSKIKIHIRTKNPTFHASFIQELTTVGSFVEISSVKKDKASNKVDFVNYLSAEEWGVELMNKTYPSDGPLFIIELSKKK